MTVLHHISPYKSTAGHRPRSNGQNGVVPDKPYLQRLADGYATTESFHFNHS